MLYETFFKYENYREVFELPILAYGKNYAYAFNECVYLF